jgi:FKBP-type peptidyl-prolyl cis-trans isomerase SlyD
MQTQPQYIADNMVVSLAYTLVVDGEELSAATREEPMEYLHGYQEIVSGLEAALAGKKVGDRFSVTLEPAEAYGEYDEENLEEIDRSDIEDSDDLEVGMVLEVEDEDGFTYMAHVSELGGDTVLLDFNPPLAGKTLTYTVEVLDIRLADEDELEHGHAHGSALSEDDEDFDDEDDLDDDFDAEEEE